MSIGLVNVASASMPSTKRLANFLLYPTWKPPIPPVMVGGKQRALLGQRIGSGTEAAVAIADMGTGG